MKKIFLLLSIFGVFLSHAYCQSAELVVFSEQGEPFQIILNGLLQNETPRTNVRVRDLKNEYYTCKIMFSNKDIPDIDKDYLPTPLGNEVTFRIRKNNKGKFLLAYQGETPLTNTNIVNTPDQQVIMYNTTTTTTTTNPNPSGVNIGVNLGGVNGNISLGGIQTPPTTTTQTVVYVPGYQGTIGCPMPMDAGRFEQAKQSIGSKPFEDNKIQVAKQVINNNCVTASQVKDIMGLFSFEDSKLDIAKYCYKFVYDVQNYYIINDAFTFSSSVDDLNTYIAANPVRPVPQPIIIQQTPAPQNPPIYQAPPRPRTSTVSTALPAPAPSQAVVVAPAGNCAFPMRDSDFSGAKSSVSKQSFDDNKLKIAKQIVGSNCLTSAQVKELVGLMTYENNKVELAKHCYKFTYDPNNYFMVYDAFTYKSSTDELSKFIGR